MFGKQQAAKQHMRSRQVHWGCSSIGGLLCSKAEGGEGLLCQSFPFIDEPSTVHNHVYHYDTVDYHMKTTTRKFNRKRKNLGELSHRLIYHLRRSSACARSSACWWLAGWLVVGGRSPLSNIIIAPYHIAPIVTVGNDSEDDR